MYQTRSWRSTSKTSTARSTSICCRATSPSRSGQQFTFITGQQLSATDLANNSQIELSLSHNTADTTAITGSFQLLGSQPSSPVTFDGPNQQGQIFTNGVDWTRAQIFAYGNGLTVSGPAEVGQTLTVNASANDSDLTLHYTWMSSPDNGGANHNDWVAIANAADSSSYTVQAGDLGKNIEVVVSGTDPDRQTVTSVTSASTASVVAAAGLAFSTVVVAGNPVQEGQQLQASAVITGDNTDMAAAITYQWQYSGDNGVNWQPDRADWRADGSRAFSIRSISSPKPTRANISASMGSFTDDAGRASVTAYSTPTAPVADVTAQITAAVQRLRWTISRSARSSAVSTRRSTTIPSTWRRRMGPRSSRTDRRRTSPT